VTYAINADGWIEGANIVPSVRHSPLLVPRPIALVHHATATKASAERLTKKIRTYNPETDRAASWHLLAGKDGTLWQSVPLTRAAWHCSTPLTARGIRWRSANRVSTGLEWENAGPTGKTWPAYTDQQRQLWRDLKPVLVAWAGDGLVEFGHYELDPARRSDPGRDWMNWLRSVA
jgi:N-acetyl-anhydromuramyl-L-alanine amidase AmpD